MRVAVGLDVTQKVDHFSGVCVSPAKNWLFVGVALVPVMVGLYLSLGGTSSRCSPPPLPWTSPHPIAEMGAPDIPATTEWVGFSSSGTFPGTLATYQRAEARGFTAMHLDVQVGRDGTLVVLSADDLRKIGETSGRVSERDEQALITLQLARDTPVALVSQIFAALGDQVTYLIHLPSGEMGARALQELDQLAGDRKVVVASDDQEVLLKASRGDKWPTLWYPPRDSAEVGDGGGCASGIILPADRVMALEVLPDLPVVASGVDTPEVWARLQAKGVGLALTRFTSLVPGADGQEEGGVSP